MAGSKTLANIAFFTALCIIAETVPAVGQDPIPKGIVAEFPPIFKAKPLQVGPGDDELKKLMIDRLNVTISVAVDYWIRYRTARGESQAVFASGRRLLRAGMDLKQDPNERLEWLTEMVGFSNKLEVVIRQRSIPDPLALKELQEFRLELAIERIGIEKSLQRPPAPDTKCQPTRPQLRQRFTRRL